jgi:4-amino-4-deoxy-L-arabinose transferase-like glycosyltransferase
MMTKTENSHFRESAEYHSRSTGPITIWVSVIVIAGLSSVLANHVVSLIDGGRLIAMSWDSVIMAVPFAMVCYFLGITLISYLFYIPRSISLFTAVFVLRIIIGFVLSVLFQADDELLFHYAGIEQPYGVISWNEGKGYYHLVSMLYSAFGPNLLLPKVMNALIGSLIPFFLYDLSQRFFDEPKAAWRSFLFAAFLPPLVLFSALNLKEILTAFLLVLSIWLLIVPRRSPVWRMVGAVFSSSILYWLRGAPWAVVAVPGVIAYLVLGETWGLKDIRKTRVVPGLLLGILLALLALAFLSETIRERVGSRLTEETYYKQRFEGSSATVMQFVDKSNTFAPKNLGVLFLRGLYTPSPIRFLFDYSLSSIFEASVMIVWYLLFPFAVAGFLAERHKGIVVACGVVVCAILAIVSMGVMFGTDPYRHRIAAMGLVFTLAGGGFQNGVFARFRWVFRLWWIGAFLFTAVWIVFRV